MKAPQSPLEGPRVKTDDLSPPADPQGLVSLQREDSSVRTLRFFIFVVLFSYTRR